MVPASGSELGEEIFYLGHLVLGSFHCSPPRNGQGPYIGQTTPLRPLGPLSTESGSSTFWFKERSPSPFWFKVFTHPLRPPDPHHPPGPGLPDWGYSPERLLSNLLSLSPPSLPPYLPRGADQATHSSDPFDDGLVPCLACLLCYMLSVLR